MEQYFVIDGRGDVSTIDWAREETPWMSITTVMIRYFVQSRTKTWDEAAFERFSNRLGTELRKPSFTHRLRLYLASTDVPEEAVTLPGDVQLRRLSLEEREDLYQWAREYGPMTGDVTPVTTVRSVLEYRFELPRGRSHGFIPIDTDLYRIALRIAAATPGAVLIATQRIDALCTSDFEQPIGRAKPGPLVREPAVLTTEAVELAGRILALLQGGVPTQLETAVRRLDYSTDRDRVEDRFLDLVVGLESIVNGGDTNEVTFKFRQRLAALIGRNAGDRQEIFASANAVYSARSKVAHGEKTKKPLDELTRSADWYLRRAITALLEQPDYRSVPRLDDALLTGVCRFVTADSEPLGNSIP
jgi:hypothetical protein